MQIRTITSADTWDVANGYVAAFHQVDPAEEWTAKKAQQLVSFFLKHQPDLAFMAEVDGRCAGAVMGIVKPWWNGPCLVETEMFVDPQYARKGVGTLLGQHYVRAAVAEYDVQTLHAITFKNFEFPAALFSRVGFIDKSEWKVIVADAPKLLRRLEPQSV